MTCETGEIVGLLGRNGSGKSTLLKIIFGTIDADNQYIKIDDTVLNSAYKSSGLISYLPQYNFLPLSVKVKTLINIQLNREVQDVIYSDEAIFKIKELKVRELSYGQLRYLQLKLLLLSPSKFVLLDEPFAGISPLLIEKLKSEITELSKTKGIIITDHSHNDVSEVSARVYNLKDGRSSLLQ